MSNHVCVLILSFVHFQRKHFRSEADDPAQSPEPKVESAGEYPNETHQIEGPGKKCHYCGIRFIFLLKKNVDFMSSECSSEYLKKKLLKFYSNSPDNKWIE